MIIITIAVMVIVDKWLCHLPRSNLSRGRPSLSLLAERIEASLSVSASMALMASLALLAEFMWAGPADLPPACIHTPAEPQ